MSSSEGMIQTAHATAKREMMGRQSELEVIDYLERYRGVTAYDVAKGLGWSYGKVAGVLKRIEDEFQYKEIVEFGRAKKKIYLRKADDFLK